MRFQKPHYIHVGNENFITAERVLAVLNPKSSTARRILREAQECGTLLDFTAHLKTRGIVLFDTGIVARITLRPRDVERIITQLDTN